MRYFLAAFFIFLLPCICMGAIYKVVDSKGNVTYTDQPTTQSKEVTLPPSSSYSGTENKSVPQTDSTPQDSNSNNQNQSQTVDANEVPKNYQIKFANIEDQQTFQNTESIHVDVDVTPSLDKGYQVKLYYDGKLYDQNGNGVFTIVRGEDKAGTLQRGEHTLRAELVDENGKVVAKTNTKTIFVHYARVGQQREPMLNVNPSPFKTLIAEIMGINVPANKTEMG